MEELFFVVLIASLILIPFIVHFVRLYSSSSVTRRAQTSVEGRLCLHLFQNDPSGLKRMEVVEDIMNITNHRFSEDDCLDYYLKIKGLQYIDMNFFGDNEILTFLMQPTKVTFEYHELVAFYEKYLNHPTSRGTAS